MKKKWDTYIYGDVNIDLVVPGVEELPAPGTEVDVETMETFVGGGAALFAHICTHWEWSLQSLHLPLYSSPFQDILPCNNKKNILFAKPLQYRKCGIFT